MQILGIGVDVEEVGRFRELPYNENQSFYQKTFTTKEIEYCNSKDDPSQHFAARFSVKEAVAKALGKSIYNAKEFEIINNKEGKPLIKGREDVLITLSHTRDYAIAFAVWLS